MNSKTADPNAIPPKIKKLGGSSFTFFTGTLLVMLGLGIGLVVYCFDPTQTPFYPVCTFHQVTGLNCPGCGTTRSLYALLHGRWLVALRDNALFIATLAVLSLRAVWLGLRHLRRLPPRPIIPTSSLIPWLVIALIFGVARNLPALAILSP